MRKPIVDFVRGDLFLLAAVCAHPPDLHRAAALGIEVNELAVGRIVRAVVESLGGRETPFFAAGCGNRVDVEITMPLGATLPGTRRSRNCGGVRPSSGAAA